MFITCVCVAHAPPRKKRFFHLKCIKNVCKVKFLHTVCIVDINSGSCIELCNMRVCCKSQMNHNGNQTKSKYSNVDCTPAYYNWTEEEWIVFLKHIVRLNHCDMPFGDFCQKKRIRASTEKDWIDKKMNIKKDTFRIKKHRVRSKMFFFFELRSQSE